MALPREPRQKMINIMYLVLTAILALNVSAEVIEAFKTVDKSLQGSNANLTTANAVLYKSSESFLAWLAFGTQIAAFSFVSLLLSFSARD